MAEQHKDTPEDFLSSNNEDEQSQSEEDSLLLNEEGEPLQPDEEQPSETVQPEEPQAETTEKTAATIGPEIPFEPNGGPLGCCLGMSVGLFLSLILAVASRLYADPLGSLFQQNYGLLGLLVRILMAILAVTLAIFCGILGWRLGKHFYREYEPPTPRKKRKREKALT